MILANPLPTWQKAIIVLTATMLAITSIAVLYWGRLLLIPLSLAVLLTFVLSPLVSAIQRRGLGRLPAVAMVMATVTITILCVGWIVVAQFSTLLVELPNYSQNVQAKSNWLQETLTARGAGHVAKIIHDVGEQIGLEASEAAPNQIAKPEKPPPQEKPSVAIDPIVSTLGSITEMLGQIGLAVILAIFMLLKKEDLRNRIIRLLGDGRLTVTTRAIDDAAKRISRFLLTQFLINASFGVALGIALLALGVEYALLWAFLAATFRYVPYVGSWIGAVPAMLISLITAEGWLQPLAVIGIFVVLEAGCVNLLEPWLLGHSLGISEVSQLMAAACWAILWGPLGLVLSGPMTVCLLVLAKHVPELHFITILLGDEPALDPATALYQRLAAKDQDEADQIVANQLKEQSPEKIYDELFVPALTYTKRDLDRHGLTGEEAEYMYAAMRETMEEVIPETTLAERDDVASIEPLRILACPARDEADSLALEMLGRLLDPRRWKLEVFTEDALASELVNSVANERPAVTCVAALPPGGLAHARYLCKRLRKRCPDVRILVGRWGLKGDAAEVVATLKDAGADHVDQTLLGTIKHLHSWWQVLVQQQHEGTRQEQEALV